MVILTDFAQEGVGAEQAKKSGLAAVTLNLRFQPRLPGSVVGRASMRVGR